MVATAGERVNGARRREHCVSRGARRPQRRVAPRLARGARLAKTSDMLALLESPRVGRHVALAALGVAATVAHPRSEPARSPQLLFAFHAAGVEYVRLADDELPAHASPRLVE
ncbi:MAG: hypothetical protein ACM31C_30465, partial [Acidobacteriota bacterium]